MEPSIVFVFFFSFSSPPLNLLLLISTYHYDYHIFFFSLFYLTPVPSRWPTIERREHVRLRDAVKERLQIAVQMLLAALGLFPARPDVGPAADCDGQRRRRQHQSQQPQQHR